MEAVASIRAYVLIESLSKLNTNGFFIRKSSAYSIVYARYLTFNDIG